MTTTRPSSCRRKRSQIAVDYSQHLIGLAGQTTNVKVALLQSDTAIRGPLGVSFNDESASNTARDVLAGISLAGEMDSDHALDGPLLIGGNLRNYRDTHRVEMAAPVFLPRTDYRACMAGPFFTGRIPDKKLKTTGMLECRDTT